MIIIYGKETCNWCDRAKELCHQYGIKFEYKSIDDRFDGDTNLLELKQRAIDESIQVKTVPQIWWNGSYIGGFNELVSAIENTREYGQGGF